MTPEGKVKQQIRNWLIEQGLWRAGDARPAVVRGWFYMPQNNGMGVSGIPDFVGCVGSHATMFGIEAKKPGGRPTALQLDRHAEMRGAHGMVIVADKIEDLVPLLPHIYL